MLIVMMGLGSDEDFTDKDRPRMDWVEAEFVRAPIRDADGLASPRLSFDGPTR
jgi:hypothetical protein